MNVSRQVFKSYFSGFTDLFTCENDSKKKTLGLLKIISYFSLIIPLAFIAYRISCLCGRVKKTSNDKLKPTDTKTSNVAQQKMLPELQNVNGQKLIFNPKIQPINLFPYSITIVADDEPEDFFNVPLTKPIELTTIGEFIGFTAFALELQESAAIQAITFTYLKNLDLEKYINTPLKDLNIKIDEKLKLSEPPDHLKTFLFTNDFFDYLIKLHFKNPDYHNFEALRKKIDNITKHFSEYCTYKEMKIACNELNKIDNFLKKIKEKIESLKEKNKPGKALQSILALIKNNFNLCLTCINVWEITLESLKQIYLTEFKIPEIEKILNEYPVLSCKPQPEKPIFQISLEIEGKELSAIFDEESLCKQSPYFKGKLIQDPNEKDIALDGISPEVFNLFVTFLNEGILTFANDNEEVLIDLYDLASQIDVPRLRALAVKEIAHRLRLDKWQNMKLMETYTETDLLGQLFVKPENGNFQLL